MKLTLADIAEVVRVCSYDPWVFVFKPFANATQVSDSHAVLQVEFTALNRWDKTEQVQRGRKWMLSTDMTRNEVVQTCFLAVLTAQEHEVREQFRYRGRAIFNPHWNPDSLYDFAHARHLDLRPTRIKHGEDKHDAPELRR